MIKRFLGFSIGLVVLVLPYRAFAAIAFDNAIGQQTNSGGAALTFSYTTTGTNRYLLVGCLVQGSQTMSSVTYNNVSMTQLASVSTANVSANETSYVFGLANPTSGANNVVATPTGSPTVACVASSYTGTQQTTAVEVSGTNTGAGQSGTNTITTITNNDWLAAYGRSTASISSAGSNTTLRATPATGLTMMDSNADQTPPGNFAQNFTASGGTQWGMITVAIKPFSVSIAPNPPAVMTFD